MDSQKQEGYSTSEDAPARGAHCRLKRTGRQLDAGGGGPRAKSFAQGSSSGLEELRSILAER